MSRLQVRATRSDAVCDQAQAAAGTRLRVWTTMHESKSVELGEIVALACAWRAVQRRPRARARFSPSVSRAPLIEPSPALNATDEAVDVLRGVPRFRAGWNGTIVKPKNPCAPSVACINPCQRAYDLLYLMTTRSATISRSVGGDGRLRIRSAHRRLSDRRTNVWAVSRHGFGMPSRTVARGR